MDIYNMVGHCEKTFGWGLIDSEAVDNRNCFGISRLMMFITFFKIAEAYSIPRI